VCCQWTYIRRGKTKRPKADKKQPNIRRETKGEKRAGGRNEERQDKKDRKEKNNQNEQSTTTDVARIRKHVFPVAPSPLITILQQW
jgi:hypothetical protein